MKKDPFISIITPVYNEPKICRSLNSVIHQKNKKDIEVIVVDGGSTDETLDCLEKFKDYIDVLIQENDSGIYDAMNKGIRESKGEVVGILNADDYYYSNTVLSDVSKIFLDTSIDICYGDLVYVNPNGKVKRYWKSGKYKKIKWYFGWMPPHPTVFIRKEIYETLGRFNDIDYKIAADYELMLRFFFRNNLTVEYLQKVVVSMELGGESNKNLKNIIQANREVFMACKENKLIFPYLIPFLKVFRKPFQYFHNFSSDITYP